MASGLSQLLLCASTITLLSSILNQLCPPCAKLVVGLGKRVKKSELAPSNGESQTKKSEVVFSLPITASSLTWSSAVVGWSKWPTYLHWGTAYHHLAKLVNFLCTNVFKSPDKTFRMRQSFISLLSHQRWIFFSNLYAAQPACLLSFAAFVAKRRDNRGWLPSKFPPLKLAFWSK